MRAPKTRATLYADDSRMMDQRSASAPKGRTRMNMARGMYGIFTKHASPKAAKYFAFFVNSFMIFINMDTLRKYWI